MMGLISFLHTVEKALVIYTYQEPKTDTNCTKMPSLEGSGCLSGLRSPGGLGELQA